MQVVAGILGAVLCLGVALDAFHTIILPRRPSGRLRITRFFYILTWTPWVAIADRVRNKKVREQFYSTFGPGSLIVLLVVWATILTAGFALLSYGLGSPFEDKLSGIGGWPPWLARLRMDLYVSGTTLFTLGLGDVVPRTHAARVLLVLESGTGLGFFAMVIGYLPVIYQAFSRREISVAMLDARAGSPPTATELLRRHGFDGGQRELIAVLSEFERWAAEILESHISYPVLCMYRSQHDNQSWLGALVAIMDTCALVITTIQAEDSGGAVRQAQLTFAMARHALIDLGHVFHMEKKAEALARDGDERLPAQIFDRLCDALGEMQMQLCGDPATMRRLAAIRELYEPHAQALAGYLKMPLPLWIAESKPDAEKNPWMRVHALRRGVPAELFNTNSAEANEMLDPLQAGLHVSDHATSLNLHDEEHGFGG